jgi:hypothetical protein
VYEGISDDGQNLYVEFGEVATVGRDFEFTVFTYWLPPIPWPVDAVSGVIRFSPAVASVKRVPLPEGDVVGPQTVDYVARLGDGKQIRVRTLFLDAEKSRVVRQEGAPLVFTFEGSRDYDSEPEKTKQRSLSQWLRNTDTCYVKFIFSTGGESP